ncbi:DUF3857 domain-containing transglutaminase family protein [Reichenbachiella ulvae]|uniref:DUF3857 domain-containing transglutaminase family protein n=1 Tax=Reichenbachiella ulvae TaxID=2980104 RepID=A0ABT3CXW4_9BACT|nr:DUF3857 domain-containing transglutaminase family protein [Reichenbachiella ulvae]MCV9388320.1 DUF3857 domain-containing transglutaminase family protein [Reichenbachiella ulvae]
MINWKKILSGLLFFVASPLFAQNYSIDQIPDSLLENANAVYFVDEMVHEIINSESAIQKSHVVIAILNKKAKNLADQTVYYDGFRKINRFEGKVYDANGELIDKTRKSDIYDRSAVSGSTIYSDGRLQYLDLTQNEYPYIVEFWIEREYLMTYSTPNWYVMPGSNVSVMKSHFSVTSPDHLMPNFKLENTDQKFYEIKRGGKTTLSISYSNMKAVEKEPYGPSVSEFTPVIFSSPSQFSYDGYAGTMYSWQEYGKWMLQLNEGKDDISLSTIEEIEQLTKNANSDEEKARIVYDYLQNKTRYVSIQLGIGGLQPFPASTVDEYGYGDCKALSNYTQALLKAIDVESYYTIVYGGENPPFRKLDKDFTMDVFNHIILCVPNQGDTLWLECTSQTNPFGYQGNFTGDRDVLLVTPEGGKLAHTTIYEKEDNLQFTKANVSILEGGDAKASFKRIYTGLQYENNNLNWKINDGEDELKKWIYNNTQVSDFKINDFSFELKKDKIPSIIEEADISIHSLASGKGKRMFITPNLMNRWEYVPKRMSDRKTEVELTSCYIDSDSIIYEVPEKYHVEFIPEDILIETEFGKYEAHFSFDNHQLIYTRRLAKNKGRFPKESYQKYREFTENVKEADHKKVVFIDKT